MIFNLVTSGQRDPLIPDANPLNYILGIGILFLLIALLVFLFVRKNKRKKSPTLVFDRDIRNITCKVKANDDYTKVVVNLQVYNSNNQIIVNTNLVGYNYKKDNEYTLKYALPLTEPIQTCWTFKFKVEDYY